MILIVRRKKYAIKKFLLLFIFIITCLTLAGCNTTKNKTEKTTTVTDMLGEKITINKNPKKVACVSRTTYDLLVAFGLQDKIDGAYSYIYKNPWTKVIHPNSTKEYQYNYKESYETFLTRGIDLVFSPEKKITDGLKKHGINALTVSLYGNPSFDNYLFFFADLVKEIWDYDEVKNKVDEWKSKVNTAITEITNKLKTLDLPSKKIMYVRGDKNNGIGYTDQVGSFTEFAFRKLGFDFAGSHFKSNKPSKEEICNFNPDIFVIGGVYQNTLIDLLKKDNVYNTLESVKNNKIYNIPVGLTMFEQLSVVTPIFFYDMANKIYPEHFNYDIKKMVIETMKEYFKITLTEKEVNFMLTGKDILGNDLAK